MMRNGSKMIFWFLVTGFLVISIIGCGSSGGMNDDESSEINPSETNPIFSGTLSLRASRYTIESDNEGYSVVTATLVNGNNSPAVDTVVSFSTDGGMIVADQTDEAPPTASDEPPADAFDPSEVRTDALGRASIRLMSGPDRSNRIITVTATANGNASKSVPIQVTGTAIWLDNDNTSLDIEGTKTANLLITVQDAEAFPINDAEVNVSVEPEGSLTWSPSSGLRTDVNGRLVLEITGRQATEEAVLRIEASGDVKTQSYLVYNNADFFTITSPAEDPSSWPTGRDLVVTVRAPRQNTVRLVTSFGQWRGSTAIGRKLIDVPVDPVQKTVTAVLSSAEAGIATIQVFDLNRPSVSDTIQVAFSSPSGEACRISLQASATVMAPSLGTVANSVELTAKVRSRFDQAVGNVPVMFFLDGLTTTGGGERLSPAIAYTDSQGFARSTFFSGTLSSYAEGVKVTAAILDADGAGDICNLSSSLRIVIGGTAGSISIGQSTEIESINGNTAYRLPMSVLVSDAGGNPMPNTTVTLKLWSTRYATGYRGGRPDCPVIYTDIFENEDVNRNLMCDYCAPCPADQSEKHPLNEDLNGDCELTPSSSAAGALPSTIRTDEDGLAGFSLVYLKENAAWLEDEVVATAVVYGTEIRATLTFWLPILEGDSCNLPGESPFNRTELGEIVFSADPENVVGGGVGASLVSAAVKEINSGIVDGPENLSSASVGVLGIFEAVCDDAPNGPGRGRSAVMPAG